MTDYKEVPISAAQQIAEEFDKDQVIIVTWDAAHQVQHVTTYGKSRRDSAQAAQGGNFVKEALGWPDRLCHDAPEWWQTNMEEVGRLADTADNLVAAAGLAIPVSFALEQLKVGLGEMSAKLKEIYTAVSGEKPWEV
ncbi:MAG: hypothetical protein KJ077_08490 [Anaerolineae bacterium]|nr:hypothetical protein [Anaerolineae bacterium]